MLFLTIDDLIVSLLLDESRLEHVNRHRRITESLDLISAHVLEIDLTAGPSVGDILGHGSDSIDCDTAYCTCMAYCNYKH